MRFLFGLLASIGFGAAAAAQGTPDAMRGPWFAGSCAAPTAMLHLTARAAARLPSSGPARLWRFSGVSEAAGWTVGTARGPSAPRLLLRAAGDALESVEPDAKTRDDRLPADGATPERFARCPTPPAALMLLHAEGLAGLAALEVLEAGCGGAPEPCVAAVVVAGDVTGDRLLSAAELARLGRSMAWVMAAQVGADGGDFAAALGIGSLLSLASSRSLVDSLDYDGDGRLSAAELGQDRVAFGAARGDAAGTPLALDWVAPALEALRGLIGELDFPR